LCGLVSLTGLGRANIAAISADSGTGSVTGRNLLRRTLLAAEVAVTLVLVLRTDIGRRSSQTYGRA
jgi:hypothetical protein